MKEKPQEKQRKFLMNANEKLIRRCYTHRIENGI